MGGVVRERVMGKRAVFKEDVIRKKERPKSVTSREGCAAKWCLFGAGVGVLGVCCGISWWHVVVFVVHVVTGALIRGRRGGVSCGDACLALGGPG